MGNFIYKYVKSIGIHPKFGMEPQNLIWEDTFSIGSSNFRVFNTKFKGGA